jgi:hypothetical protein
MSGSTELDDDTTTTVAPGHGADEARARRDWVWRVIGGGLASVVTATLLAAVDSVWLTAPWALGLVLFGPTAQRLDRRIAFNLSLLLGLTPVALWVPQVLGTRTAAITVLAIGTGATVACAVGRAARLVPRARPRDAAIAVSGGLAGLVALPLAASGDAQRALAMLSTGIDNAYHYAMYLEQRLAASGSPLLASAADDTGFAFDDYPQWFHRMLTVTAQLGFGDPGSSSDELVRYATLQWLVFVVLAVLVTAAFLQALPDRVDPWVLTVAMAVLLSLLLGVPGGLGLLQGHLSFLVAASAPLVMFLLGWAQPRPGVGLFVVLGGLVLVTASWMLLLPLAGAALLPPVVAVWRRQHAVVRWGALAGVAVAATGAFVLFVLGPLTTGGLYALLRDGTVPEVWLPAMLALLVGSTTLVAALARRRRDLPLGSHLLVLVVATGQMLLLGGYMLVASGELTYYFWKLGLGSLLVVLGVTTHAVVVVRSVTRDGGQPRGVGPLATGLALLGCAAGIGVVLTNFTAPSAVWAGAIPLSVEGRASSPDTGDADLVLRLATGADQREAARTRVLATREEDMNPAHASEWFHALSHSSTRRVVSVDDGVYDLALDRTDTALALDLAEATLAQPDGLVVVTDPGLYEVVLGAVTPEQARRVTLVR